jgi:transcriptional regulator with XRE-family HTH domain
MTQDPAEIVKTLVGLRRAAGESQTDLADALGVSQPTVSAWERGKNLPPFWQMVEWADRYGVGIEAQPRGETRNGRLAKLLSVAATLPDAELDDLVAIGENLSACPVDVRMAAVQLVSRVTTALRAKTA